MKQKRFLIGLIAAGAACTFTTLAQPAQGRSPWSADRPVTIVVPYAPGGTTDAFGRAVAKAITAATGQPVVVENQPGADGLIGTRRVIESKPDGHTLLMQIPALTIARHVNNVKDYDPLARLDPITAVAETPLLVVTNAAVPAQNFRELVDYCRKAAPPCSLATPEATARVLGKRLAAEPAGIPGLLQVNYKGTSPIVTDLVGGQVTMTFVNYPGVAGMYTAGKVKIVGVMDQKRSPVLPNVPTLAEVGYPQFDSVNWFGLFAPKGMPPALLASIADTLQSLRTDAELQRLVATTGAVFVLNSPAQFREQVVSGDKTWAELARRYPVE